MALSFEGYQTRSTRFQGELESDPDDVFGATAEQALSESPVLSILRSNELFAAGRSTERLSADTARARLKEAGLDGRLTVPDSGIAAPALDILMDRKRAEMRRQDILGRAPSGVGMGAKRLGMAFAASVLDPVNVGLAFVPVVGEARYMGYLAKARGIVGRTAVRAGVGAAEGAVGAAIIEPLIYATKTQEQADYEFQDSLLNVAFGMVLGGGLHVTGGAGADAVKAVRAARASAPLMDAHVAARIEAMSLPEREVAMRTAVSQAMQGKAVDVETILPRSTLVPAEERLIRRQIDDAVTARETQLQAVIDGPEGLAVRVRGADNTSERLAAVMRERDADAAMLAQDAQKQSETEAFRLAQSDNANAYAIARSREQGSAGTVFEHWRERAEQNVTARRQAAGERVKQANELVQSMQGTLDRASRMRSAEADIEQLRHARNSAKTIDDLVDALPVEQQPAFRRRIGQGRADGYVRQLGSELPAALERQASPASDMTADVRAAELADSQLSEGVKPAAIAAKPEPAQKASAVTSDEIADQESLLAAETAELEKAMRIADVRAFDVMGELAEFDEALKLAEVFGIAARAGALCGAAH